MTLQTIYQVYNGSDQIEYHSNDNIKSNLNLIDLDMVMTHRVTITYFDEFILTKAPQNLVYLNIYKSVEIYKRKLR